MFLGNLPIWNKILFREQTTQDAVRHPIIQHKSLLQEQKTNL